MHLQGHCNKIQMGWLKYKWGGLNNIILLFQSSIGQKSKIKMSTRLITSSGYEGESVPCFSLSFRAFLATFGILGVKMVHPIFTFNFTWCFPCLHVCISNFPHFIITSVTLDQVTPKGPHFNLITLQRHDLQLSFI